LCVWLWFAVNRRRNRIEVADDAIRYVHWSGEPVVVISRTEADELRILRRLSDSKLFLYNRLVVPGTDMWMNLKWFSSRAVRAGMRGPRVALRQRLLTSLFGPRPNFRWPYRPGEMSLSLGIGLRGLARGSG
jgi:hypothetical protein